MGDEIIDHTQTEEKLRKALQAAQASNAQYRQLIETTNESIIVVQDGLLKLVNPITLNLLGADSEQELIDRPFLEFIHPDDRSLVVENYRQRIANEASSPRYAFRVVTLDDIVKWVEINATLIEWQGKPATLNFLTDITELKLAEKKLRVNRDRFRAIFDRAGMGIVIANETGYLDDCNAAFSEMLGYDKEELLQKHFKDITISEDLEMNLDPVRQMIAGQIDKYQMEKRYVSKEGRQIWCSHTLSAIRGDNGELIQVLSVVDDISKRKLAETALQESEKRYRALFENATLAIFQVPIDGGKIIAVNPMFASIFGYKSPEDVCANVKNASEFFADPQRRAEILRLRTERPNLTTFENLYRRKDGSTFWGRLNFHQFTTPDRTDPILEGFIEDITDRKRDDEALKRYSEKLEDIVEERTKQLQQAARLATIGEMATMVGHDLRNPLQVIVSMAYLLKEMLISAETPQVVGHITATEILDDIEKSCSYMNQIVSDLQSYAGMLNLELVETDIRQLIIDAISFLEIPDGVEVSTEVENGLTKVTVDPKKIKRVILNLVSNSIQSMPKGGQITITAIRKGESVVLTIRDEGEGIPDENIPKLFLPLFTTKSKGIGLGLAICKRLVEAHGGNIVVTSKVNAGTEVTIEIPQDEKTWTRSLY